MSVSILNKIIAVIVLISSLLRIYLGFGLNPTKKTVDLAGYELVWQDDLTERSLTGANGTTVRTWTRSIGALSATAAIGTRT